MVSERYLSPSATAMEEKKFLPLPLLERNMVKDSEKYHISANDYDKDLYYSDSDEEHDSDSEEEVSDSLPQEEPSVFDAFEYATTEENDKCKIIFRNFGQASNLDSSYVTPVISIKPASDGYTIKIGEITCFLIDREKDSKEPRQDSLSQVLEDFDLSSCFLDHKISTFVHPLFNFKSEYFGAASNMVLMIPTLIHHGSATIDLTEVPASWFSSSKTSATTMFRIGRCGWPSNLHVLCVTIFDPGGIVEDDNDFAMPHRLHFNSFLHPGPASGLPWVP